MQQALHCNFCGYLIASSQRSTRRFCKGDKCRNNYAYYKKIQKQTPYELMQSGASSLTGSTENEGSSSAPPLLPSAAASNPLVPVSDIGVAHAVVSAPKAAAIQTTTEQEVLSSQPGAESTKVVTKSVDVTRSDHPNGQTEITQGDADSSPAPPVRESAKMQHPVSDEKLLPQVYGSLLLQSHPVLARLSNMEEAIASLEKQGAGLRKQIEDDQVIEKQLYQALTDAKSKKQAIQAGMRGPAGEKLQEALTRGSTSSDESKEFILSTIHDLYSRPKREEQTKQLSLEIDCINREGHAVQTRIKSNKSTLDAITTKHRDRVAERKYIIKSLNSAADNLPDILSRSTPLTPTHEPAIVPLVNSDALTPGDNLKSNISHLVEEQLAKAKQVVANTTATQPLPVNRGEAAPAGQNEPHTIPPIDRNGLPVLIGDSLEGPQTLYWDPLTVVPKRISNSHLQIIGLSGSGKTQSLTGLLHRTVRRGLCFTILALDPEFTSSALCDAKGRPFVALTKAKILDASQGLPLNPLALPLDPESGALSSFINVAYQIASNLGFIFKLGSVQQNQLRLAIEQAYAERGFRESDPRTWKAAPPTMFDVHTALLKQVGKQAKQQSLLIKLEPLLTRPIFNTAATKEGFNNLWQGNVIVKLSSLPSQELRDAVSQLVLFALYQDLFGKGIKQSVERILVVDEAHKFSHCKPLQDLLREGRKFGYACWLASQSPEDFSPVVSQMVGTHIMLQLKGKAVKAAVEQLGITSTREKEHVQQLIQNFSNQEALVSSNHFVPYHRVRIKPFREEK